MTEPAVEPGVEPAVGPVVVGVDGSAPSLNAVTWAADEAARRARPLRVAYSVPPWVITGDSGGMGDLARWWRGDADRIIAEAVERARAARPGIQVSGGLEAGTDPYRALRALSEHAALLVVGSRGLGGFLGLVIGSVSLTLSTHASCPVVVVRSVPAGPRGQIVLGVDGSVHSTDAIGFAMEEAALRGARVTAVHAWSHPLPNRPGDMIPLVYDLDSVERQEIRLLGEAMAGWREKYPDVEIRERVIHGHPVRVLSELSQDADLLVVGAGGHRRFGELRLGSVSHGVLHHAHCPTAVVPAGPWPDQAAGDQPEGK